jgi:hypothetical protein
MIYCPWSLIKKMNTCCVERMVALNSIEEDKNSWFRLLFVKISHIFLIEVESDIYIYRERERERMN